MKILLISPLLAPSRVPEVYNIGLGYVGAALRAAGHQVDLLDIEGNRYAEAQVEELLKDKDFEVAAIGTLVTGFKYMKWLTALIRRLKPGVKIWVGNSIGSTIPETILREMPVDVVVMGEGEVTAVELAAATAAGKGPAGVNGTAYLEDGQVKRNPDRELIENLDGIAMPAWDLFNQDLYIHSPTGILPSPRAYVITTRGCPYQCTYCYHPFQNQRIRAHSAERVVAEIKLLKERYGIRGIVFGDDLFTVDKKRVREVCRLLIEGNVGVKWMAAARVNTVDLELLTYMREAGCVALGFGVESASPVILKNIKKHATAEQAAAAIKACREAGIYPACSFMIGNVGETRETVEASVRFMTENDLPPTDFFFSTPYPGTELYEYAKAKGLIKDEAALFGCYAEQGAKLLVNFTDMSDEELIALRKEATARVAADYRRRHPLLWARDQAAFLAYYIGRFGLKTTAQKVAKKIFKLAA
ncbi:MAG: hypothetical protein A2089_11435 [Elusimicrobia bacterium GWD2_63_28]|nr:MAG: hypothetical protein A2089_11435 [Elusimicrobia bacterium GWD2_63_28]